MTDHVRLTVDEGRSGSRLDAALAELVPNLSRSRARALIDEGHVLVNGRREKASHRVSAGDSLDVEVAPAPSLSAAPESIPLNIVYQDRDMVIIDKPAGMVVHPAAGHERGTLANALVARYPETGEIGSEDRPGIVHRLDKDTSGLMMAALSSRGQMSLQEQIADRTAERRYLALVAGRPEPEEGVIDGPIGRDPGNRKRMALHGVAAREARTRYRVLQAFPAYSLVEAKLDTGRTHQVRVHFAAIGHPIAGDATYGGPLLPGLTRQFLHAYRLGVRSPESRERLEFSSKLPPDLRAVLDSVGGRDIEF